MATNTSVVAPHERIVASAREWERATETAAMKAKAATPTQRISGRWVSTSERWVRVRSRTSDEAGVLSKPGRTR